MAQPLLRSNQLLALLLCVLLSGPLALSSYAQAPAWQTAQALIATAGSGSVPYVLVQATTADASGNIYIAGQFSSTLQLGTITLNNTATANGFVAKWSPASSSFIWAQVVSGDNVSKIAVSGTSVYIAGTYRGTVSLGSTTLTNYDATGSTSDIFVAKYTDAGSSASLVWAQRGGSPGSDAVNSLVANGSAVYMAGSFQGATALFGGTTLANASAAGGTNDLYIAKLVDAGSSATYSWALRAGSAANDEAIALAVSGSTVYLAGGISGTAGFGTIALTSAGGFDGFVAKVADAGSTASYTWVQRIGGAFDDEASCVVVNGSAIYVGGIYSSTTLVVGSTTVTNGGSFDGFVTKLTDAGTTSTFTWAQNISSSVTDIVYALAVNQSNVYVTGLFGRGTSTSSTLVLGSTTLASAGGGDIFVARLLDAGSSSSYGWAQRAGGAREDQPTGMVIAGSRVYVGGYFTSTTASFGTTTLTNPGGVNGGQGGFLASLADPVLPTRDAVLQAGLALYPNPAHGTATVRLPAAGPATLTLFNLLGQAVRTQPAAGPDSALDLTGLAPGVYALRVQAGEALAVRQLVVE